MLRSLRSLGLALAIAGATSIPAASLVGCNDPAKDKPQATVTEAVTIPSSTAAPSAAASAPSAVVSASYEITPENSKVEWTGSKVTGSHDGAFTTFHGAIAYAGSVEASKVLLEIDTASLTTTPEKLVGHLKSPDFFDVEKFPKAAFTSTSITAGDAGAYSVTGNLMLHGVAKSVTFPATITVAPEAVDAKATFAINRKDFGLNYPGKANDLIRDDVVIKLTIHAVKKR